jgi:trk system potassium uptake protein TrkA
MYIVVYGGGKVGSHLASLLAGGGHDVVVIEPRPAVAERLSLEVPQRVLIIRDDGCDDRVQRDAGVGKADLFASVSAFDGANLVACRVAQVAFRVPRVVSRISNPKNEHMFRELGIEAISATSIIARLIQEELGVQDIHTLASLRRSDLAIVEVPITEAGLLAGTSAGELSLPDGAVPVAFVRGDEVFPVSAGTQTQVGDVVIAFRRIAKVASPRSRSRRSAEA